MSTWTDELKQQVIEQYKGAEPTPETSSEIIKDIAEEHDLSPNGVRMVLVQAGVYVKKDAAPAKGAAKGGEKAEGAKRVSKEDQINALKKVIEAAGGEVNDEILDKLTGKAAAYFVQVFESLNK